MALLLWMTIACLCFIGSARAKVNKNLQTLNYSELEKLGASCAPKDTCSKPRSPEGDNLRTFRCQCQASCAKANTCCIDSPHARFMPAYWNRKKGTCQSPFTRSDMILAVSKCEPGWSGSPEVKAMCEEPNFDLIDPIGQSPTTNTRTEVTYRNYFCALCNNDIDSLVFWQLEISQIGYAKSGQNFDRNNILESLKQNEYGQWAVEVLNEKNETILKPVLINYATPDHISHMLTPCTPMVSECSEDWQDDDVRAMCRAYMGIVYLKSNKSTFGPDVPYRNIHCAICNNIEYNSSTVCEHTVVVVHGYGVKPPFSFTLLLDVNLADGDKVGEVNRCGQGKMYDPFFKKCRTLTCAIPGYAIQEEKCVKV